MHGPKKQKNVGVNNTRKHSCDIYIYICVCVCVCVCVCECMILIVHLSADKGCQPYAPADFTAHEIFLVLISVTG